MHPTLVQQDFQRRVGAIASQGMGLSVDVYSPDLFELVNELSARGLQPGYLEVFKATTTALTAVRKTLSQMPLAYHGEGLWITQPDVQASPFFQQDVGEVIAHLNSLKSLWLNHECAMKQMAGYSFGTYVPPLYTELSAEVVADNIATVQTAMDRQGSRADGTSPLFLLEMPPLTYFVAGTISIPHFFRIVTERAPCGLVLDIGHLWTVYRYTNACRQVSLEQFVREFLAEFPLERVVEIHVAGLDCHESIGGLDGGGLLPEWLDAHAAPIPRVLFAILEQVLAHPNLVSLRGVALEVDTKPIETIVAEYAEAVRRFALPVQQTIVRGIAADRSMDLPPVPCAPPEPIRQSDRQQLREAYAHYAKIISGQVSVTGLEWQEVAAEERGVTKYRTAYLPHEILHWGGDLTEMFPRSCRILSERGVSLNEFVAFWFREPRPLTQSYDFFLLKIERFFEFVLERAPDAQVWVQEECEFLRQAYAQANEVAEPVMELEQAP